ncbi:MAG: N-acetylmuramoyl-L-alanine amidase [Actinobacteria bacterium]|nr:N-acetylmuramoyl-L-alanine amidase [Actinomycetota bacterium]MBI3687354.1 N-acetylmuramoyl-L-alanine amidase [Actinomycetota bacterium]
MQLIRRGDTGPAVAEVRGALNALGMLADAGSADPADALFDGRCELAVRQFQQCRGLSVDGIVGPDTYRAITEARWHLGDRLLHYSAGRPIIGDDIASLQERLLELGYDAGFADGVFGQRTEAALRQFQRDYGLVVDGQCGPTTFRALQRLGRKVVGGRPQILREAMAMAAAGPHLMDKRVVIDPGHGGDDPGVRAGGLTEAAVVWDLAARLEGRLAAHGVTPYLSRGPDVARTNAERAEMGNATGADMFLSLHVDGHPNPLASGIATYHYGTGSAVTSTIGEKLAGLVHRELVARTGMRDCRIHGKTWQLLRWTRMPTVWVDLGYLTNPEDRSRLADPAFRDIVADGVLVAIQRMYFPEELDPPTGSYRMPAGLDGQ